MQVTLQLNQHMTKKGKESTCSSGSDELAIMPYVPSEISGTKQTGRPGSVQPDWRPAGFGAGTSSFLIVSSLLLSHQDNPLNFTSIFEFKPTQNTLSQTKTRRPEMLAKPVRLMKAFTTHPAVPKNIEVPCGDASITMCFLHVKRH